VFIAVAFPLNEVLQSSLEQATVDHRFNFILLFSVNQNGIRRWVTPPSGDRVQRCSQQFDHWKDGVETAHGLGQAETVGICSDMVFYNIRARKRCASFLDGLEVQMLLPSK
jgi:hypothetical protein